MFFSCRSSPGILLKGIFEVWGEGEDHNEVEAQLRDNLDASKSVFLEEGKTFKVIVDSFGHVLTMDEQMDHLKRLEYIPFKACGCSRPSLMTKMFLINSFF